MKRLSEEEETVRIFVPVTVTTRERFRELCADRPMAEVLREHIEAQVEKKAPQPAKPAQMVSTDITLPADLLARLGRLWRRKNWTTIIHRAVETYVVAAEANTSETKRVNLEG